MHSSKQKSRDRLLTEAAAAQINEFWRDKGMNPSARAELKLDPVVRVAQWVVVSNMYNGTPLMRI